MKKPAKRLIYLLEASTYLLVFLSPAMFGIGRASAFSGNGAGTSGNPYVITSCVQLQEISDDLSADYTLGGDIDCSDTVNWNSGSGFIPIGQNAGFSGQLDGRDFTVTGMLIAASGNGQGYSNDAALFLQTGHALIKNLTISELAGDGQEEAAALVDNAYGTVINNVHVDDTSISTDDGSFGLTGGIVAFMHNDSAVNSITQSSITDSSLSGGSAVGGLVGYMDDGSQISTSYGNDNSISSIGQAGGLAGIMAGESTLSDSYSVDMALSSDTGMAGGLVGQLGNNAPPVPSITDSYATGAVSSVGDYAGALVGYGAGAISNSFATALTSGNGTTEGGLTGTLDSPDGGSSTYNAYDVYQTAEPDCSAGVAAASCLADLDIAPVNDSDSDPDYFFDNNTNRPMDKWDFSNTWALMDNSTPVLNWQGIGHAPPAKPAAPAAPSVPKKSLDKTITDLAASNGGSVPAEIALDDYSNYTDGSGQVLTNLVAGQVVHFDLDNGGTIEHHTATVKAVSGNSVTFTIASTPFDVTLSVGDSRIISLDGKDVLKITLNSVKNGVVDATFSKITGAEPAAKKSAATPVAATAKSHAATYIGLAVLAAALAAAIIYRYVAKQRRSAV